MYWNKQRSEQWKTPLYTQTAAGKRAGSGPALFRRTGMIVLAILCLQLMCLAPVQGKILTSRTVVDRSGEQVTVPARPQRILVTCYGGATHEIALLGKAANIVADPSMGRFPLLLKIYPMLSGKPDAGSFDNVNIEFAMSLKPDLVVASIISAKTNERLKQMGLPVVTVGTGWTNVERLLREFTMMGEVLAAPAQASALVAYWQDKINLIRQRTAHLSNNQRKTVYYCSSGSPLKTEGSVGWGESFIRAAGGINVSTSMKHSGVVTPEQLMVWNPDVIVTGIGKRDSPGDRMGELRKLATLKAVANGDIHYCPVGAFWWDRPSPEAVLGILWLAQILYPDLLADVDLRRETKEFYRRFYQYALSDAEYDSFVR